MEENNSNFSERTCEGCDACCTGTLAAEVRGYEMERGKPCIYLDSENHYCKEYSERPKVCSEFLCQWMKDAEHRFLPEYFKPSICNFILTLNSLGDKHQLLLHQVNNKSIDPIDIMHVIALAHKYSLELKIVLEHNGKTSHSDTITTQTNFVFKDCEISLVSV